MIYSGEADAPTGGRMSAAMLRVIAIAAICVCDGAVAIASAEPRHAQAQGAATAVRSAHAPLRAPRWKHSAARTLPVGAHVDRAAPYKADRLSSSRAAEPILNIPGQTTVLTREMLDDMNATSVKGALRSVAGVTIGR
ncbi:Plug domain-containing protein [Bradyrhizobium sp.]|uniref:Plug domain-containing protein n=1 Tax=Bradyrhizobium sp. TaxID=376 RepID=UPI002B7A7D56|nr:Plug domain-containing protein [Bradyrhizobium sp.]HMM91229.1 Plug domain-containing protein [Bradyrhizobium sp.]